MPLLTEYIPKHHRVRFAFEIVDLQFLRALEDLRIISAGLTQASEIALDVGHENRNATRTEILRECLERNSFSGPGGASDQAVAVRHFREQKDLFLRLGDENRFIHTSGAILNPIRGSCRA